MSDGPSNCVSSEGWEKVTCHSSLIEMEAVDEGGTTTATTKRPGELNRGSSASKLV